MVVVFGGIGNIFGVVFGGLVFGWFEMLFGIIDFFQVVLGLGWLKYIIFDYKDFGVFLVLLLIFFFKFVGLFGKVIMEKV